MIRRRHIHIPSRRTTPLPSVTQYWPSEAHRARGSNGEQAWCQRALQPKTRITSTPCRTVSITHFYSVWLSQKTTRKPELCATRVWTHRGTSPCRRIAIPIDLTTSHSAHVPRIYDERALLRPRKGLRREHAPADANRARILWGVIGNYENPGFLKNPLSP